MKRISLCAESRALRAPLSAPVSCTIAQAVTVPYLASSWQAFSLPYQQRIEDRQSGLASS
jgi:hypothetical protein